jgi:hypothetical protein
MDEIEKKYKDNYTVNIRYQRWMMNPMQNTLWSIDGNDPIPEDFIVIKNGGPVLVERYSDALIGEKADAIHIHSEDNDHILKDIYTDSNRSILVSEFLNREDNYYKPRFGNMKFTFYDYDSLWRQFPKEINPVVLKFENGTQYDVIQFAGKELLLYIFPNISLIGMYKPEELKEMGLEKIQMLDKEYLEYLEEYKKRYGI